MDLVPDLVATEPGGPSCGWCLEVPGASTLIARLCDASYLVEYLPGADALCGGGESAPRGRISVAEADPGVASKAASGLRACAAPPSYDGPGAGHQRFVSPEGDDAAAGTRDRPWRSLEHAIGQLRAGDTLLVRGGTYRERGIEIGARGEPEAPIAIVSSPGEQVVIDGSFEEFQAPDNEEWVRVAPATDLWRSRRTYGSGTFFGKIEVGGKLHALNVYDELEALASRDATWNEDGRYYVGPGLHWNRDDGHLYIRLQPPDPEAIHGRVFEIPADPDPRRHRLFIGNQVPGLRLDGARHLVIEGLAVRHFLRPLDVQSGASIALVDLDLVPGRTGVLVETGVHDLALTGITFDAGFPAWVSWRDVKSGPRVAKRLKLSGMILRGAVDCVSITQSRFVDVFDGITATGGPERLTVRHNEFDRVIDDALQLGTAAAHVEFAYNLVFGPGPAHHGSGPSTAPGTKYIHHNVIHIRYPELYSRVGEDHAGWRYHIAMPTHSMGSAGPDPWKIYNNTLLFHSNTNNSGAGQDRDGPRWGPPHEVYNNIFVQQSDHRVARGERVDDGAEIFDGNLYHRTVPDAREPLFQPWHNGEESRSFASLAEFRSSDFARATRSYYPPGWEQAGIEADPMLGDPDRCDYRPDPAGPAASGALDLAARGWPGAEDAGHRGAVAPRAPTGLGAVGRSGADLPVGCTPSHASGADAADPS